MFWLSVKQIHYCVLQSSKCDSQRFYSCKKPSEMEVALLTLFDTVFTAYTIQTA